MLISLLQKLPDNIKDILKSLVPSYHVLYSRHEHSFNFFRGDSRRLRLLKNKFKGKRVFIVGNGPSLNQHDLTFLKNEYSFAVNGIFYKTEEMGYKPTFYTVEDKHVLNDNLHEINQYDIEYKFFPSIYKPKITNRKNTYFFDMNFGYYSELSPNFCIPRFSPDICFEVYAGQSVTMANIQIAYYLGFSEVYLIGMDHSYQIPKDADIDNGNITSNSDDPNHFHPNYFGKGKKWHDPHLDRVERNYQYFKLVYEAKGRHIYNATIGGNLEVFDRVDYKELFRK